MLSKCWPLRICAGRDVIKVVCVVEILAGGKGGGFLGFMKEAGSLRAAGMAVNLFVSPALSRARALAGAA
jgi:hypothetical protein